MQGKVLAMTCEMKERLRKQKGNEMAGTSWQEKGQDTAAPMLMPMHSTQVWTLEKAKHSSLCLLLRSRQRARRGFSLCRSLPVCWAFCAGRSAQPQLTQKTLGFLLLALCFPYFLCFLCFLC